jgi:Outer membrane protein Omp28/Secretion system C-terminal sorting domain
MHRFLRLSSTFFICLSIFFTWQSGTAQTPKYATLELFTNTPCPICGSQNPGLFTKLQDYEGEYHLVSFYPGKPYSSCIFYQANISENTTRLNFYPQVFGTPTVAINGTQFKSSAGVSTAVLDGVTGGESWLSVDVDETTGGLRTVNIALRDHVGGSATSAKLFAVIVERLIVYNAPNGETMHHNVFRKFLTNTAGDNIDMSSGAANKTYQYALDASWQADETYVVAWVMDPDTKEIFNSGTKYDPDITSGTRDITEEVSLRLYPNPAASEINIALSEEVHDASFRVFDVRGRVISEQVASGAHLTLNTSTWPVGNYQVSIEYNGKVLQGKFAVVR